MRTYTITSNKTTSPTLKEIGFLFFYYIEMTAQEKLLQMITEPQIDNVDFWVLLDNIIGIERLTDIMIDNVKSRDEGLCEDVLEDIQQSF